MNLSNAAKIKVLYVDDEPNNLQSFVSNFRNEFDIRVASSAEEGLEMLHKEQFHVVVSDNRMPAISGVEFLEQLVIKYPEPVRILLTAYTDLGSVIDAINKSRVFSFIDKPWDSQTLKDAIYRGYEFYRTRSIQKEELEFFVYKASHDLRGPLSSMKSLLEMAQSPEESPESIQQFLALIDKSLGNLMGTLNELIEYKKMDRSAILCVPVDFEKLLQEITYSLQNLARFKDIHLEVKIVQNHPFLSDISIVRSILQNLIHNAINYSRSEAGHKPTIKVGVHVYQNHAHIEVSDNGMGMTEKTLQKVFDMFYRNHFESTGSGLGLYIVKKGIEKAGGQISVKSEFRVGTSFEIELPSLQPREFQATVQENTISN